jgi:hypothetical protein
MLRLNASTVQVKMMAVFFMPVMVFSFAKLFQRL